MPADAPVTIRPAVHADIDAIVALFAADEVGGHGDTSDISARPDYVGAFERIAASACDTLWVADMAGDVVGTFQTTLTTTMTGRGRLVMTIEAVQTRADLRGRGVGAQMIRHAIETGRGHGARLVQLSSNAKRVDAHRFYERLGFSRMHFGFKMNLL